MGKNKYIVLVVETDSAGNVLDTKLAVELLVDDMEAARWQTHQVFESSGILRCDHAPLPIPRSIQARMEAANRGADHQDEPRPFPDLGPLH